MGSVYGLVRKEAADLSEKEMFRGDGLTDLAECFPAVGLVCIKAAVCL